MIFSRRASVLQSVSAIAAIALAAAAPPAATEIAAKKKKKKKKERTIRKSYPVAVTCSPLSVVCPQEFEKRVTTSRVLEVEFIANPLHFITISVSLSALQNGEFFDGGDHQLAPGASTGVVKFTGIRPGGVTVSAGNVQASAGSGVKVSTWEGTLKVKTSKG